MYQLGDGGRTETNLVIRPSHHLVDPIERSPDTVRVATVPLGDVVRRDRSTVGAQRLEALPLDRAEAVGDVLDDDALLPMFDLDRINVDYLALAVTFRCREIAWNSNRPSCGTFASRLTPSVLERRAPLLRTVDNAAAVLVDGRRAVNAVPPDGHVDHLRSLTESQASDDPRLPSC